MKRTLSRIFLITMAFNVLISTHGLALYEHLCKFTFQKSYSLSRSTCDTENEKPVSKKHDDKPCFNKDSCCEVSVSIHKLDVATDGFLKLNLAVTDLASLSPEVSIPAAPAALEGPSFPAFINSSPPPAAEPLYILFQVFRI